MSIYKDIDINIQDMLEVIEDFDLEHDREDIEERSILAMSLVSVRRWTPPAINKLAQEKIQAALVDSGRLQADLELARKTLFDLQLLLTFQCD